MARVSDLVSQRIKIRKKNFFFRRGGGEGGARISDFFQRIQIKKKI